MLPDILREHTQERDAKKTYIYIYIYITPGTWRKITYRKEHGLNLTEEERAQLNKTIKRLVRKDKRQWQKNLVKQEMSIKDR